MHVPLQYDSYTIIWCVLLVHDFNLNFSILYTGIKDNIRTWGKQLYLSINLIIHILYFLKTKEL